MKNKLREMLDLILENKIRRGVALTLAILVTFSTTYSLVLPAVTLERETAETMAGISLGGSSQEQESSDDEEGGSEEADASEREQETSAAAGEGSSEETNGSDTDTVSFDAEAKNDAGETETLVHVEADAGAFPEGTTMEASVVTDQEVLDSITDAAEGEVVAVRAVDLTFSDENGETVQPAEGSQVSVTLSPGEGEPSAAQTEESPSGQDSSEAEAGPGQDTETTVVQYTEENGAETVETSGDVSFQVEPETGLDQENAVSFDLDGQTADGETQTYAIVETVPEEPVKEDDFTPAEEDAASDDAGDLTANEEEAAGEDPEAQAEAAPEGPGGEDAEEAEVLPEDQEIPPEEPQEAPADEAGEGVLTAQDDAYLITLAYGPEAMIPQGASLQAEEILSEDTAYEDHLEETKKVLNESAQAEAETGDGIYAGPEAGESQFFGARSLMADPEAFDRQQAEAASAPEPEIVYARFFDITILDAAGDEVTPAAPVRVSIELLDVEQETHVIRNADATQVVHFGEETEVVEAEAIENAVAGVTFDAAGFSVYGVVYAQISTRVITDDGADYTITLAYGPGAGIPDGAVLEAEEIEQGSEAYLDYLARAGEALNQNAEQAPAEPAADGEAQTAGETEAPEQAADETAAPEESLNENSVSPETAEDGSVTEEDPAVTGILTARFFDIRILADGEVIEPAEPVKVTISYTDPLAPEEDGKILAVHFGQQGTEVIETTADRNSREVVFMQGSFSVTGTVVTSNGNWPNSAGDYVMYVQSGGKYYAVAHSGVLHEVTVNGSLVTFPDDENTLDLNEYLWKYELQSNWVMFQGWVDNRFVYYLDAEGHDHYLSPSSNSGIDDNSINLSRNSNGYIYNGSNFIGVQNNSIVGHRNQNNAVPIQFANGFEVPRKVTIHFVDRNGNPLTGVSYTGSESYPVTARADGTFTVPYNWEGTAGTLHLDTDFSKSGYTYASTHLAGTRQGTDLTYDGLTIDAALTERSNALYYNADAGDNVNYGQLIERKLNDSLRVPNENGTGSADYLAANVDKDIYVILDPVPTSTAGQQTSGLDVDDPEFNKTLKYNEDGTYTLSLSVKGHGVNAASDPKANVIFVVDTSSSMDKTEGTGTGHSRLHDTKPALKTLARDLLLSNSMAGKDNDTVEVSMVSFDGGVVDELDWTTSYSDFTDAVDNGLVMHRGTDWEDALKRAYEIGLDKQAAEPDQQVFVVFFTDGEGSQYSNFHGQGTYNVTVNPNYGKWYSYFLSRETAKDEARAIVNAGMQFYAVYAFNKDGSRYNGEAGSDLLHNLVKYGYNSGSVSDKHFFAKATSTHELEEAFNSILLSIREFLGFTDVVMNDDITSLTSTGINLVSHAVGGFTYTRSGGRYGAGQVWQNAPEATHVDSNNGDASSVQWDLGSTVLEDGVTYTVSFKVWPSQEAYDWLANLNNGTKTWNDVVAAGLDSPNGANPQIVKNGDSYSLLTNKPSVNSEEEIINNRITYRKTHSETVTSDDIPAGTQMGTPIEGTDSQGNKTITTYTLDNGVYTRTVVTEKETCFPNPEPMPLVPERMSVMKDWQTSMNTSHPADELKFRVLVDGKYYQNDGSLKEGEAGQANAKELPVSGENSWKNTINIAPGIVKFFDDDGTALDEALVLETGHMYTLEEFDLMEGGSPFLYYTSYEFHSQTMRPMIVDGTLKYLVLVDDANPAPADAETYVIGGETYFTAASGSGQGTLSGTNYRTAELDITKIIRNQSGAVLTDTELDAESFTYRVTLQIPDGTDPAGIVGYEYIPRTQDNAYTLFGYQEGETAFADDIQRFSGKTFRAWNTLVYRDLVEWENIGGRIVSKTDQNGDIIWKVPADEDDYHSITYDMTLNRNEVIRFTNLPTGTKYSIQEIYANYYQADNADDSAGHAPIEKASNIAAEGYEISQVLTTNGTVTDTAVSSDTVSGTIDTPNVRYYNQFTNDLKSVKAKVTILKTNQDASKPLPGAVFDLYDEAGYAADPREALKTGLVSSAEAGKEGLIELGSLAEGVYYLVETDAPDGYNRLDEPVVITVSGGDVTYEQSNSSLDDSGEGKSGDLQNGYQLIVVNDAGVELPSTGGPGTGLFMVLGSVLAAGAALLLWKRREIL